jgi:hypothetical protein
MLYSHHCVVIPLDGYVSDARMVLSTTQVLTFASLPEQQFVERVLVTG